jgi:poly-gamma-glutamate capsule biosynthesis protein CapA/YwtB (metallophosphatase superfamily)
LAGCHPPITVVAGGDLQLGSHTSLAQLQGLMILDGDLRLANLEGPITARGGEDEAAQKFAAAPALAKWLHGRLDAVSLANNHALDQGPGGRADTVRLLAAEGLTPVVDEAQRKGVTLLGRFYPPDDELDGAELLAAVRRAPRPVIVLVHWGHTGSLLPSPEQRRLGQKLIDAGATAVLGHGPHSVQGVERRGRGVIAYSLGNLAFSCPCTDASDAYLLRFKIARDFGADAVETIPIRAGIKGEAPKRSDDPGLKQLLDELSRDLAARPGG